MATIRRSSTKNDLLQNYVESDPELGKEKQLIIDIKTRWNSLLKSNSRFVEVHVHVHKTLVHFKMTKLLKIFPSEDEIQELKFLVQALDIIEAGTRTLGGRKCDLAYADRASIFQKIPWLFIFIWVKRMFHPARDMYRIHL